MARRRSVYLSDTIDTQLTESGRPLPEIIILGLEAAALQDGRPGPTERAALADPHIREVLAAAAQAPSPQQPRRAHERCPHPKARVIKGLCHACGQAVRS